MSTAMPAFGEKRIARSELPAGRSLCEYCTAKCCKYFALPIDAPETFQEFEYLRWFLLHERASVFKEDDDWYLLVHTVCKHLQPDNRCGIYETRPQICRDYTTDKCEYDEEWTYDFYLETPEQVWEFTEAILPHRGQGIRSRRPDPLAIVTP